MQPFKILPLLAVLALGLFACQPTNNVPVPPPDGGQPDEGRLPGSTGYACVPQNTLQQFARLVQVIDGDTIDVEMEGRQYRVRYIGVDTPERGEPFYSEATAANQSLLAGEYLLLVRDVSEIDQYGRLLRYVFAGEDRFVNHELVSAGYALSATFPPDVACADFFLEAQIEAREQGRGLWGDPQRSDDAPGEGSNSSIIIDLIHYDGQVPQVESDEFIVVKNTGLQSVEITNWKINAGSPSQEFIFPAFLLQAGQSCRVYTNQVHPESCGFSFGIDQPIWSNQGECGYLYDPQGLLVDTFCYD